jgi:hypothetical protein
MAWVAMVAVLAATAISNTASSGASGQAGKHLRSFFGVNFNFYPSAGPRIAKRMASGGVGSVLFGMDWSSIEVDQGTYDWAPTDRTVKNLARHGVQPIPVLYGSPTWAVDASAPPDEVNRQPPNSTQRGAQGWANFLAAAARRYGPGGEFWRGPYRQGKPGVKPLPIHTWEAWNEPNLAAYFWPTPSAPLYAGLLRISHDALKSVDPHAQIAIGGLPCKVKANGCVQYLKQLYQQPGVKSDFDLVGLHPYGPSVSYVIREIKRARKAMRAADDGRTRIWVSEVGWGSGPPSSGRFEEGTKGQAKILSRAFRRLARQRRHLRLWKVTWFNWQEPLYPFGNCAWCQHAGLMDKTGQPKPSWRAYRKAVR